MLNVTGVVVEAVQALVALAMAPGLVGLIRWMKARMQGRRGAPVWTPYFELRKLFRKETVVSPNASWISTSRRSWCSRAPSSWRCSSPCW